MQDDRGGFIKMNIIMEDEFLEKYIDSVKSRKKFVNCYFNLNDIKNLWQEKRISAYDLDDCFLFIEKRKDMSCLYYMCNSWEWIKDIKEIKEKDFKMQPLVISFVQNNHLDIASNFEKSGFPVYKIYQRLRQSNNCEGIVSNLSISYSTIEEFDILIELMNDMFDILSDHIPNENELKMFIQNKQVICVHMADKIVGFIIFEDKNKTSYIRMVCVDKNYQGCGIGKQLMSYYFQIHKDYKSFTLWYDIKNVAAFSLYSSFGYVKEDICNYIFVI